MTTEKESLVEENNDKISVLTNNVNDSQSKLASAKETIVSLQSNVQDVNSRMAEMTEEQTRLLELISSKVGREKFILNFLFTICIITGDPHPSS